MKLDPERVQEVFLDCMFKDGEDTTNYIEAAGIVTKVGFHPGRIEQYKPEIADMLNELPESFHADSGGGMSFLNACEDKNGNQWTGMHRNMEQLFQLGIACGYATCLMPRDMWSVLPGGMPYYAIDTKKG